MELRSYISLFFLSVPVPIRLFTYYVSVCDNDVRSCGSRTDFLFFYCKHFQFGRIALVVPRLETKTHWPTELASTILAFSRAMSSRLQRWTIKISSSHDKVVLDAVLVTKGRCRVRKISISKDEGRKEDPRASGDGGPAKRARRNPQWRSYGKIITFFFFIFYCACTYIFF